MNIWFVTSYHKTVLLLQNIFFLLVKNFENLTKTIKILQKLLKRDFFSDSMIQNGIEDQEVDKNFVI